MKILATIKPVEDIDHTGTGVALRAKREIHSLTLETLAYRLGWSVGYLSDLERGRRNWTQERVNAYLLALRVGS